MDILYLNKIIKRSDKKMITVREILKSKGYKIDFSPSIFYGLKFEDGTIDLTWTLWILHPYRGYSPTLYLMKPCCSSCSNA